jgi:hypothetical protein
MGTVFLFEKATPENKGKFVPKHSFSSLAKDGVDLCVGDYGDP